MKNNILLAIVFICFLALGAYTINLNQAQKIKISLENNLDNLEVNYKILLHSQKTRTNSIIKSIFNSRFVKNILIKANLTNDKNELKKLRKELNLFLSKKYKILAEEGVLQFHIVFPNNKTFLRVHKPSKYDDDLTTIRADMAYVNKIKKPLSGFYHGKTSHSFKNIFPLYNNKQYLGLVDIGYSSKNLQDFLNDISKIHTHFLVKKDLFKIKEWNSKYVKNNFIQSFENKNYLVTLSNHIDIEKYSKRKISLKLENTIDQNIKKEKAFVIYNKNSQNKANAIAYYPVRKTISNDVTAWIVAYTKNNEIKTYESDKIIMYISLLFVLILVFLFTLNIINQKEVLNKQVIIKTSKLENANNTLKEKEKILKEINENLQITIQNEVEKSIQVKEQLSQTQQLASMGEMIGNIAHQWRQPLSIITTHITSLQLKNEMGTVNSEMINNTCTTITSNAQYLSKTIDDFRNFVQGDVIKEEFSLKQNMQSLYNLTNPIIKDNNITLIQNINDMRINSYPNELNQCLINIINNSKDAFENFEDKDKFIFIETYEKNNHATIRIKDTGGGIPGDIIHKVFDPYFTTKHKSKGTGIGLNMVYNIITDHMKGDVIVQNVLFTHEDIEYSGAEFIISIKI